jgi:hypothetical protein
MKNLVKNKKGWIKILEAFIAIVLIVSTMLIIFSNQKKQVDRPEEMSVLLSSTLDVVSRDDSLRSQILANDASGVNITIEKIIPSWIAYSSKICNYNDICSNPAGYIDKAVYSEEILVVANLTYIANTPKKLKIFFWEK